MARYGMAVDTARCIGCNNCSMACKVENNLPANVLWNRSYTLSGDKDNRPDGTYPSLSMDFYTLNCQHCSSPACVEVCPTGASYVVEGTNVVLVDNETCIGCESCIAACPYGVRVLIDGEPEYYFDFALGDYAAPVHKANTVEKCTFCHHRLQRGERPACADVCRCVARFFGDLDDPESEVSKALVGREHYQLQTDQGTEPNVFFLK